MIFDFDTPTGMHGQGAGTHMSLHENDIVVMEFPLYWPVPLDIANNDCGGAINAKENRCYSIPDFNHDRHIIYWTVDGGGLSHGDTIRITLVSSQAVITPALTDYIKAHIYHDGRLIHTFEYDKNTFGFVAIPITPTITCGGTTPLEFLQTAYEIQFKLP